ncbi:hypothetical protein ACR79N_13640 [Sphingobacterium siyangense]|uniref:Uncharacterized protein n=1 Tax=Sphingobacterium siyangense TaxID=459529 RepID=A0A562MAL2_9SPHI|nr:hypothetical protein [Sphingobacterium siyangense]TWI16979.1 hypothetical protein IQ31_03958 [Sphingobacterium siyangense]
MAILKNGNLKGAVGNIVFRQSNEQTIVQTIPKPVKKPTPAKKAIGSDFGHISTAGARIREFMGDIHLNMHDSDMHNRLITQLKRVVRPNGRPTGMKTIHGGKIDRLVNFQFNDKCHIHDFMHFDPDLSLLDKQVHIRFPKFDLRHDIVLPKHCDALAINFTVAVFNFELQQHIHFYCHEIELNLHRSDKIIELEELIFDMDYKNAETIIVGMNIEYYKLLRQKHLLLNNKEFHPAAIVAAFAIES